MKALTFVFALLLTTTVVAEEAGLDDIFNFRSYSDAFASAGQPSADQLKAVADAGFDRVIYLAFSDHERSLPAEDRVVTDLGMGYVQIPVDWQAPTRSEFEIFAAAMSEKTFLHCQANFRASAFAMLYRVIHGGVPLVEAQGDMLEVWTPNGTWTNFIRETLEANGVDPDCEGCGWEPSNF